jgi:flagellar biosynthesis protein FlhG
MNDQASTLRKSMLRPSETPVPRGMTIALLAGKGGVGTTTVAVNLAVAMARLNRHVCLFDADTTRFDAAYLFGLSDRGLPDERIQARDGWYEHLPRASAGVHLASAIQFLDADQQRGGAAGAQLARRLARFGHWFDVMIVDVGCQSHDVIAAWSETAHRLVLVTAAETVTLLNSYAMLKRLSTMEVQEEPGVVFNQVFQPELAMASEQRLVESSRRFLGRSVRLLGRIPFDTRFREAYRSGIPAVLSSPTAPAARTIDHVAEKLAGAGRRGPTTTAPKAAMMDPPLIQRMDSSEQCLVTDEGKPALGREFVR